MITSEHFAPKVSVAILTYNHRNFVAQAIDSALMQVTDFPVEIRIGDDCSTDGTQEILLKYKRRYPDQIFLNLRSTKGSGIAGRRNNMSNLASCRGRYVALLDGDDYWLDPEKLQQQSDFLDGHSRYSAIAHNSVRLDQDTGEILPTCMARTVGNLTEKAKDIRLEDSIVKRPFQTSSICLRRDLIDPLPAWFESLPAGDVGLFLMLANRGPIRFLPDCKAVYRVHSHSVMQQLSNEFPHWMAVNWTIALREFPGLQSRFNLAESERIYALSALGDRRYGGAALHALRMLFHHPIHFIQTAVSEARARLARFRSEKINR
jgi:glycosyltransferase involved in cell wall biosynthesis